MSDPNAGSQLTPQQEQYVEAAAALSPDKSLERIDALAKFVFANVAVVGTILAGLGLFTGAALTLRRGPGVFGVPLTISLVAASLVAGIGALFPTLSTVNPGDLNTVQRFFSREIPRRGLFAMCSLTLFAGAVVSASAVAVLDAAPAQRAPAISIQLIGGGRDATISVHSQVQGLPNGSLLQAAAVGRVNGRSQALCRDVTLVDASGKATFDCHAPAGRFRSYTVTTRVMRGSRTLQSNMVSLMR